MIRTFTSPSLTCNAKTTTHDRGKSMPHSEPNSQSESQQLPLASPQANPSSLNARPASICSQLDKNLLAYSLVASAACVSVLALAEPAEARIVATPVSIPITENGGIIQFDLNHDGIPDFGLSAHIYEFARTPPLGNSVRWLEWCPRRRETRSGQ